MPRKQASLNNISFAQGFLPEYWNWTDEEKKHIGNIKEMGEIIKTRLESGGCEIKEMYAILHDKDETVLWTEYSMIYNKFTYKHVHFVVKLETEKGKTLNVLASLIGIEARFIEKPRRGKYVYDNLLSYLIHIKYARKYQYNVNDVVTIMGRPYIEHYKERYHSWLQGRAVITEAEIDKTYKLLRMKIYERKITEKEIVLNDEYRRAYDKYRRQLDELMSNAKSNDMKRKKYLLQEQNKQNP